MTQMLLAHCRFPAQTPSEKPPYVRSISPPCHPVSQCFVVYQELRSRPRCETGQLRVVTASFKPSREKCSLRSLGPCLDPTEACLSHESVTLFCTTFAQFIFTVVVSRNLPSILLYHVCATHLLPNIGPFCATHLHGSSADILLYHFCINHLRGQTTRKPGFGARPVCGVHTDMHVFESSWDFSRPRLTASRTLHSTALLLHFRIIYRGVALETSLFRNGLLPPS